MRVDSLVVCAGKYGFRQDLFATLYLRPPAVKVISLPQRNGKRAVAVAVAERQRRLLGLDPAAVRVEGQRRGVSVLPVRIERMRLHIGNDRFRQNLLSAVRQRPPADKCISAPDGLRLRAVGLTGRNACGYSRAVAAVRIIGHGNAGCQLLGVDCRACLCHRYGGIRLFRLRGFIRLRRRIGRGLLRRRLLFRLLLRWFRLFLRGRLRFFFLRRLRFLLRLQDRVGLRRVCDQAHPAGAQRAKERQAQKDQKYSFHQNSSLFHSASQYVVQSRCFLESFFQTSDTAVCKNTRICVRCCSVISCVL